MRISRLAALLALLAPALAAAQTQSTDAQPAADAAAVIQPGAVQALSARFFGSGSALGNTPVPPAGTAVSVDTARKTTPAPSAGAGQRVTPDWSFTPGKLCTPNDPGFTEYRYAEQIPYCKRNITAQMKQEIAAHYGVPQSDWPNYEFDHLIPLAIGGNSHVDNLWPQPHGNPDGSNGKDRLEMQLYLRMKAGTMKQAEALRQIQLWFQGQSMIDGGNNTDPGPVPPGNNPAD